MESSHDTLIVGGGAIGLTAALVLADRGHTVCILEKNEVGQESSWAGAGLLMFTSQVNEAVLPLLKRSLELYPDLSARLKSETGIDPECYTSGALVFGQPNEAAVTLNWRHDILSAKDVEAKFPALHACQEKAFYYPDAGQIRNPRFVQALKAVLLKHKNVTVCEHESVQSFQADNGRITSVQTDKTKYHAKHVLVTAGAWSSQLLKTMGFQFEIFPVRGQILAFDCGHAMPVPVVMNGSRYLVPRKDGVILAGSTMEYVGYDRLPTHEAFDMLKAAAIEMMPELKSAPIIAQWAGLRPGTESPAPIIGPVTGYENLWVSTGHFRNGLVLSPASAELIADLMEQKGV